MDCELFSEQRREPEACPLGSRSPSPLMPPVPEQQKFKVQPASSALTLETASIAAASEHASTSCTCSTTSRGQQTSSEERSERRSTTSPWQTGQLALYAQPTGDGAQRFVTIQITMANRTAREGMLPSTDPNGDIEVTDGTKTFFVAVDSLTELLVPRCMVDRLQSSAGASPRSIVADQSPTEERDRWSWLTPSGLALAESATISLPRKRIPHLVGKGGTTIRMIEDIIGVIIRVTDCDDGQACVSIVGPEHRIAAARPVIQSVARGARSLLHRISKRGQLFG